RDAPPRRPSFLQIVTGWSHFAEPKLPTTKSFRPVPYRSPATQVTWSQLTRSSECRTNFPGEVCSSRRIASQSFSLRRGKRSAGGPRGVKRPLAEVPLAVTQERHERLVLLADQGDEVQVAVAVEVDHRDVDGAVPLVQHARDEPRPVPVGRLVLQVEDLPGRLPAEGGHDQVELAAAAEVGGPHVGDPADAIEQGDRLVRPVGPAAQ